MRTWLLSLFLMAMGFIIIFVDAWIQTYFPAFIFWSIIVFGLIILIAGIIGIEPNKMNLEDVDLPKK